MVVVVSNKFVIIVAVPVLASFLRIISFSVGKVADAFPYTNSPRHQDSLVGLAGFDMLGVAGALYTCVTGSQTFRWVFQSVFWQFLSQ
jgi:hypothetical protein